jgi:PhoH-like ATPase
LSDTTLYQGISVIQTVKENIDKIYLNGEIEIFDKRYNLEAHQNQYVVLNDKVYNERREEIYAGSGSSVIARVKGNKLVRINIDKDTLISGIHPKNKEQIMAFDALLDPTIKVVILSGRAGTGKSILAQAAAFHQIGQGVYNKLIFSRIPSQVGRFELGILPGSAQEKLNPYLLSYTTNFELMFGKNKQTEIEDIVEQYNLEFLPFQLIRGASFHNSFMIFDEAQILDFHEMLTLGTRIAEGSKLVVLGDFGQKDVRISNEKTGMFKFINSEKVKASKVASSLNLIKNERGEVSTLFGNVFEEE